MWSTLSVFDQISINSEEFPPQSAEETKNEMVSVSTHNDVYWTCANRDENSVRTGNNREQDWAGFSCSDFRRKHSEDLNMSKCIKRIWAYDTIIGGWKQTNISLKILSLYKYYSFEKCIQIDSANVFFLDWSLCSLVLAAGLNDNSVDIWPMSHY